MSYTLIQQKNSQHAHIKFTGSFQGQTVTWDTHFFTLNGYSKEKNISAIGSKQFIDIEAVDVQNMSLTVVLNIVKINNPSILKMMIMIKQYKNLSIGRHEYGNSK